MKNFVEQIPIKFGGFYLIKLNLVQILLSKAYQLISSFEWLDW